MLAHNRLAAIARHQAEWRWEAHPGRIPDFGDTAGKTSSVSSFYCNAPISERVIVVGIKGYADKSD